MALSQSKPGILIVNTASGHGYVGPSEASLIETLGEEFEVRVISAKVGFPDPSSVKERGLILTGSHHSVYEDLKWIREYREFLGRMIDCDKMIFGTCFGLQMLAMLAGWEVNLAPQAQVGYARVELTEEGKSHPMFAGLPQEVELPTFHFDHVEKADVGSLARTSVSGHYAIDFSHLGTIVWGVQFHPETKKDRLLELIELKRELLANWQDLHEGVAKYSCVEAFGAQIIKNYGNAVRVAKN